MKKATYITKLYRHDPNPKSRNFPRYWRKNKQEAK